MHTASSSCVLIAETGDRYADFGPYVAAINNSGLVAFRAQRHGGASGLYTGDGGELNALTLPYEAFIGHPDLDDAGAVSFIAQPQSGVPHLSVLRTSGLSRLTGISGDFAALGPLGPMMNQSGHVAFCACSHLGEQGVYAAGQGQVKRIAVTGAALRAIHGLPAINHSGAVLLRADLQDGRQGIFLGTGGDLTMVVDTSGPFQALGNFPSLNDAGTVAFTAQRRSGDSELLLWSDGRVSSALGSNSPFASFRTALIDSAGHLTFIATPRDGLLSVYRLTSERLERILGLGDSFQNSTVADFALNAVSVNDRGQAALRLRLENGRQFILRVEPSAP